MKLLALFFISTLSFAQVQTDPVEKELSFENSNCELTDSCSLKSFNIKTYINKFSENNDYGGRYQSIGTIMEGNFEVKEKSQMRDYAIVQYIKGCVYQKGSMGGVDQGVRFDGRRRTFFGKDINFKHPNWVIDSIDEDPIYASYFSGGDRHGLYAVKKDESISLLYGDSSNRSLLAEKPQIDKPIMHFSDMPTGSAFSSLMITGGVNTGKLSESVENASMIFNICIFKTKDVPMNLKPEDTDSSKAIKCFEWSNSHIYNKNTQDFETKSQVDPNCTM